MLRRHRPTLGLSLCALVAACSNAEPVGPIDDPEPTVRGVAVTLGPDGGSFDLVAPGGVEATVTFPPGAVESPQDIVITPEAAPSGGWLNLTFEPEGLILLEPATVEVFVPAETEIDDQILLWGEPTDPLIMPTVVDEDERSLSMQTRFFGLPGASMTMPAPAAAGRFGTEPYRSQHGSGANNQITAIVASCAEVAARAQADFDALAASGQYEAAIRGALAAAAVLVTRTCEAESVAVLDGIVDTACAEADARIRDARAKPTIAFGDFEAQVRPTIHWSGALTLLSGVGSCDPPIDIPAFLNAELTDFVTFVEGEAATLAPYSWDAVQDIRLELAHTWHVWVDALTLGLPSADLVRSRAIFPLYDRLRDVSYALAQTDGWHYPLSRLTSAGALGGRDILGITPPRPCDDYFTPPRCPSVPQVAGFTDDDIFRDLQHAGTVVKVEGITLADSIVDSDDAYGVAPDTWNSSLSLSAWARGPIRISGELLAFTCWNDIDADNEVTFTIDGVEVLGLRRPLGGDNYLADPAIIDVAAIAGSLPTAPMEGGVGKLVATRSRTQCDERLWGPESYELFTADLIWVNSGLSVDVQLPGQIAPGATVPVTVQVTAEDPFGEAAFFDGMDVTTSTTAGTLGTLSGVTDANGMFQTTLTAPAAAAMAPSFDGSASSHMSSITVEATANSYEGISATGQATAAVGTGGAQGRILPLRRYIDLIAQARAGSAVDPAGDNNQDDHPFAGYMNSVSASATDVVDGEVNTSSASASLDTGYEFSATSELTRFSGSAQSESDASGAAASALSIIQNHLIFEVTGGSVDYSFGGSLEGTPDRWAYTHLEKSESSGWQSLYDALNAPFSTTGTLEEGVYRIRVVVSTNSADSKVGSFNFDFRVTETSAPQSHSPGR